ncbi:AAA family ATPase [Spiribacter halobius]|nr:AAA family ATPase [Spiribacter halobius]UEX77028.1 AAA family ATPase [Spiribacter halobius]
MSVIHLQGALQEEIARIMEAEELTQGSVAREAGLSASAISRWFKGRYEGNVQALESKLRRWLDARRAKQELTTQLPEAPDWVETPTATTIQAALSYAQMASAISCIYGGAGVGKTSAIRRHQRASPNVWVVTATPTTARPGPILYRIAAALGIRTSGALHQVEHNIVERVRDTRGLLVIDEAQHLCHRALDAVRSIHDAAGIGVVLAGNEIVYSQLTGGNRSMGFAQLFSRISKRVRLGRPKDGDVDALLDAWGIDEREARQLAHHIARRPGALRGLTQTLSMAAMFAGGTPGVKHIRAAWADLGGE